MTEDEQITAKYEELFAVCKERRNLTQQEEDDILRAFNVARQAHDGTRRKSGEPYIFHPLAVALIAVKEIGLGPIAVICALLHDVVEDTDITLDQIRLLFGDRVALIVDGVTKIDSASARLQQNPSEEIEMGDITDADTHISRQAENYRKILLAMCDDAYVIFLKLCDRLHNMRTLDSMKDTKKLAISSETQYLYIPLAHRLGLYNIKTELEELVMRYTTPARYAEINAEINKSSGTEMKLKECFTSPIRRILDDNHYHYTIKTRVKSVYSCWKKMEKKGIEFNEIYDLYAMRIILDTDDKEECFKIYSLITQLFPPNPSRFRDWITAPKNNGYESLHTTVMSPIGRWVEVQIRTRSMDEVAEKGMAAHFLYKEAHPDEADKTSTAVEDWLRQIRASLENTEKSPLDLVEEFKETLYTKEIYLFTPKGETIKLRAGSTVLDFAFAIHTHLGTNCMGAKVNSKVVPSSYVLHSGEQVQILTSRKTRPDESWLNIARTPRAKEHIKDYLRRQKSNLRPKGEALMETFRQKLHIENTIENQLRIKNYFNVANEVDFYYRVAIGDINETNLTQCFSTRNTAEQRLIPQPDNPFMLDKEYEGYESHPAPCCNPIQGDEVVGIIENGGISIHRTNCRTAMHEMSTHENKIVRARWRPGEKVAFLTGINITAFDRKGILRELVRIITEDMDLNMHAITFEASEGIDHGFIMLYIKDIKDLDNLIKKIQAIDGVESVHRT